MFHLADNLFFGRRRDGSVRILKLPATPPAWPAAEDPQYETATLDLTIPPAQWCSIVASVSGRGEDTHSFLEATSVHNAPPGVHHAIDLTDAASSKDRLG